LASFPTLENVLIEITKSLGVDDLQTKTKEKFAKRKMRLENHQKILKELFSTICIDLGLKNGEKEDLFQNSLELYAFHTEFERSICTFGANQKHVLWMSLGYMLMPWLGRKVAFWQMADCLDGNMPGGKFWYLPTVQEKEGKKNIIFPCAQVVDWFQELLGMPIAKARKNNEEENDISDVIERTLYNWKAGKLPRVNQIDICFETKSQWTFKGCFEPKFPINSPEIFDEVYKFIELKKLTTVEKLRSEIPITSNDRIEAFLNRKASDQEMYLITSLLAKRYARPTIQIIRNRFHIARGIQGGYRKLVKYLCPVVSESSPDPSQNKVLQLLEIYKYTYNLTIAAHNHNQIFEEEDKWFEKNLTPWDINELFLSILPSMNRAEFNSAQNLAYKLSKRLSELKEGSPLEDLFPWNYESFKFISTRNLQRLKDEAAVLDEVLKTQKRFTSGSSWRILQTIQYYETANAIANDNRIPDHKRKLAVDRMAELSHNPIQDAGIILIKLSFLLNGERKKRPKDCFEQVTKLLLELESNIDSNVFKAPLLQYKAKHYLSQNEFTKAESFFEEALMNCFDNNYGTLRGEIARDLMALSCAMGPLIPNNHEKYYRNALFFGIITDGIGMEDIAPEMAQYFWDDLYKPYPTIQKIHQPNEKQMKPFVKSFFDFTYRGDWDGLDLWLKKSDGKLKKNKLRDVRGDTAINLLVKFYYTYKERAPIIKRDCPDYLHSEFTKMSSYMDNFYHAIGMMAQKWNKLLNLSDFKLQTPLMFAANNGDFKMIKLLLEANADPNLQDFKGRTALFASISARSSECTKYLLGAGTKTTLTTVDENTVLHTAVRSGHPEIVHLIKNSNPKLLKAKNSNGHTPIDLCFLFQKDLKRSSQIMATEGRLTGTSSDFEKIENILS